MKKRSRRAANLDSLKEPPSDLSDLHLSSDEDVGSRKRAKRGGGTQTTKGGS